MMEVVYINAVQPIKISGGTEEEHAKLYIKAGTYDFTDVSFDLNINTDLYLLEGATVTFDNAVASTAIFDIYIADGAELIAKLTRLAYFIIVVRWMLPEL